MAFKNFMGLIILAIGFTSCTKEEEQTPLTPGSASISGRLTAYLDETDIQYSPVPAGTGVTFVISGEDLARFPEPGYEYEDVLVRGTVDADGYYSVSVPATKNSVNVQVIFDEFDFDATILSTNDDGFQTAVTERRTFTRSNDYISVVEGQVLVQDYEYNTGNGDFVPTATIWGSVATLFVDNVGVPNDLGLEEDGSGYLVAENLAVIGGSGVGMIIDILEVSPLDSSIINYNVVEPGVGYTLGDLVVIDAGGLNAVLRVDEILTSNVGVPEGVLLTFTVGGNPYKVYTNSLGEYLIKVPANAGSVTVTGADFEYASVFFDFEEGEFVAGPKIYSFNGPQFVNVSEGSIIERDFSYYRSN